jgi:hypothetical protein
METVFVKVGESCVVELGGVWYRGLVEEVRGERLRIHCPDHGFTETGRPNITSLN